MSETKRSAREQKLIEEKLEAEIATAKAERTYKEAQTRLAELQYEAGNRDVRMERHGNYENRIFNFFGAVSGQTVTGCINTLNTWARESLDPITIVLDSPGGGVFAGLALVDAIDRIKELGIHITIIVRGMAASMGGVLLQSGDKRVIGRHAHLMIHEVSSGASGKTSEIEDSIEFTKRLQVKLLDLLSERSTMSSAQIKRRWVKKDWWIDAEEAIKLGFADEIG